MDTKEFLQQVLYVVATGVLPILTVYIVTLLKVKTREVTEKLNESNVKFDDYQLDKYIIGAVDIIGTVVVEVNQTYVDSLKKSGNFTEEAEKIAKNLAIEKCKQLISENAQKAIEVVYNDYEAFLSSKIEELVKKNKTGSAA